MNSRQAQIILRPIINEKTTSMTVLNKYTFEVAQDANKIEIAQAVEILLKELYPKSKTKVVSVNTAPARSLKIARKPSSPSPVILWNSLALKRKSNPDKLSTPHFQLSPRKRKRKEKEKCPPGK